MLRMTPLASAIVALLLGIEAYAAEETFDTHFMTDTYWNIDL